jgi:hypothetical protein
MSWHSVTLQIENHLMEIVPANCNSDRRTDLLLITDDPPELQVYLAKSSEKFYLNWKKSLTSPTDKCITADINADGKTDILLFGKKELGVTVFLGKGNGTFRSSTTILPEYSFNAISVSDFNNDGITDVAASSWISNEVLIFSGFGRMRYSEPSVLKFPSEVAYFKSAFIDSDMNKDLLVGFLEEPMFETFHGDGFGGFHLLQNVSMDYIPSQIIVDDVNGDGKPDAAVLNQNEKTLSIWLNNGDGVFEEHVDFMAGKSPENFVLIQHPHSNFIDAAILDKATNKVRLLYNANIASTIGSFQNYALGLKPNNVVVTDINHDGWKDLIVANFGSQNLSFLFNRRNGTFDGQIPFQTPASVSYLKYVSKNDSAAVIVSTQPELEKIFVSEINLHTFSLRSYILVPEGRPDILSVKVQPIANYLHIYALEKQATERFSSLTEFEQIAPTRFIERNFAPDPRYKMIAATIGDFDGNERDDLVYISFNEKRKKEEVYQARGSGQEQFEQATLAFAFDVAAPCDAMMWNADLNGDGIKDVIINLHDPENLLAVSLGRMQNTLSMHFFRTKNLVDVTARENLQVLDINGDGRNDIVLENNLDKSIQLYLGKGDGTFLQPTRLYSSEGVGGFAFGDLNNDGIPELIITDTMNGVLKIIPFEQ